LHNGLKDPTEMTFSDEEPGEPLELITIAEAHEQGTGEAKTKGIVTAKLKNTIHIQDETGGIAVRPTSLDASLGDEITVSGNLQDYRGLLQLDGAILHENDGNKGVTDPLLITVEDLGDLQSELAQIEEVSIVEVKDDATGADD